MITLTGTSRDDIAAAKRDLEIRLAELMRTFTALCASVRSVASDIAELKRERAAILPARR